MAVVSPPAGGGINDVFPTWRKNDIRVCPVTSPTDGGGGGETMVKQDVGAPAGDMSGFDLASETKTSVVSP
jgi:hypothetical protein